MTNPQDITIPILDFVYTPVVNFALQQNHIPVVRSLKLTNTTSEDWENVTIEISAEPDFALSWKKPVDGIRAGQHFESGSIPLVVSAKYLTELTERMTGRLAVKITNGLVVVHEEYFPIDLLAYDQWSGVGVLPEMLSAFITPNHPEIPKIIRNAATILEKWTGSPSFDEYQSRNPDRVRKQMAAIYEAIAEMGFVYCSVPASFEEGGQRVRLSDTIFSNKLANCLDLSLLYAACLEAVGIHALVIIVKGHAFCGAWLIDETFADAVNDDVSLLSKRVADGINEIAVVEATCMNAGSNVPFDAAVSSANEKLSNNDFILFVDVKRSRFAGIRPLPLRISTATGWEIAQETLNERLSDSPGDIFIGQKLEYSGNIEVSKQQLWERKLLDLTLRNSLLNLRVTKGVIQFLTIGAGKLEDALANGEEFQILAKPTDWDNPLRDAMIYKSINASDPIADLVQHELGKKRIRSYLTEMELENSLQHIFRSSRMAMEENGANTLYVGLGLLKWYETEGSEKPRYAPILLMPVEIIRKSAQKGYIIRSREEETIVNITLMEMIRQDFGISIGGLETLPKDDNGVDVRQIFNIIRQVIMSKSRWDVEDQAVLGTFSFSKFILWNDIHNNADQLCKNKVVASLVSGKLEWQTDIDNSSSGILDNELHPSHIALPISTDSSQLQAVVDSGQDKSFVLHGPPGTGKSQTITNIIANALYAGKRVLFVSAKKAALDVVQTRLETIGIGPFCLELHSNKSKKSAVLQKLKEATEVAFKAVPENFKAESDRLFEIRKELNLYVDALHKRYPFGYSLFDLFSLYGEKNAGEDKVYFPASDFEAMTTGKLTTMLDVAEGMQSVASVVGNPIGHAFQFVTIRQYSPSVKQDVNLLVSSILDVIKQLEIEGVRLSAIVRLTDESRNEEQEQLLVNMLRLLLEMPDLSPSLLRVETFEQTLAQVIGISENGVKRNSLRDGLLKQFHLAVLNVPATQLLTEWHMASDQWFLPRWLKHKAITKNLKSLSVSGALSNDEVPSVLQNVIAYQEEQAVLDKATYLSAVLGFLWNNGDCDWKNLISICNTLIQLNRSAAKIIGTSAVKAWRLRLADEFSEGSKVYITSHQNVIEKYLQLSEELKETQAALNLKFKVDYAALPLIDGDWLKTLNLQAKGWLDSIDSLKDWYAWMEIKERALQEGLQGLVTSFVDGSIEAGQIVRQYQSGLYRAAAEYIIECNPNLSTFNGSIFEDKIKKFKDLSSKFEMLTKHELYARLAAKIPSFTQEASQSSEIGILQKNIRNNGRATSIRKIFDGIPNLLHRLTPCMLMSPISVAQYFDASEVKFDLVIFDEASQMPTCEAVGAIARATNVIIVGDPKQMPPTNFFSANNVDEDNIEKEDLESILDDCLALSMPSKHLLWHYRSKHESLIAFSNAKYYDNKLLTFPSTDDITSKVSFELVKGHYDKGKTRQNRFEADAIVEEVVRRLSDPLLCKKSIGIVTFSSVQQTLIEDKLTEVFRSRPDLEEIALEAEEPVFIKNLENVQGDERDVILFSIGYGPDHNGNFSLNFGPINREGGWRRLNVAVSRARYEMKVFSTFRADELDLNRTRSEGMAGLKAFLNFAEKGKSALPGRIVDNTGIAMPEFENLIAAKIREHGYEVHTQIGCSAYRIDLGIVDKDNSAEYVLGVLCDGYSYYAAKTSKDREIVQPEVLNALGWNIHKVWSTEWWEKPEKVINGILEAIRLAKEKKVLKLELAVAAEELVMQVEPPNIQTLDAVQLNSSLSTTHNRSPAPLKSAAVRYEISAIDRVRTDDTEDFYNPANRGLVKGQIFNVIECESPISRSLLGKRIAASWKISRLTVRVTGYLDTLIDQLNIHKEVSTGEIFLWKKDQLPADYTIYRVAEIEAEKRDADQIPPEEVSNCIHDILKNQISLSKADLLKEAAKVFGFTRVGLVVEAAVLAGLDKAIVKGFVREEGNRVILT